MIDNPYLPKPAVLAETRDLATGIKLFRCRFVDPADRKLSYAPGQFGFLSAIGIGESPFGMATSAGRSDGAVEFAVQRIGTVTNALHELQQGDLVGVRAPMGNGFPMDELRGRRVIILGGGIGMAPLRPLIQELLDERSSYGDIELFCAARRPDLLVFREEYQEWAGAPNTKLHLTVDQGDEGWQGNVGLITQLLKEVAPAPDGAVAITCGPPIMIKFVMRTLLELGFGADQIITTLESKMKCGLGKCGRCNVGDQYICQDGPVFRYDAIQHFLEAF